MNNIKYYNIYIFFDIINYKYKTNELINIFFYFFLLFEFFLISITFNSSSIFYIFISLIPLYYTILNK